MFIDTHDLWFCWAFVFDTKLPLQNEKYSGISDALRFRWDTLVGRPAAGFGGGCVIPARYDINCAFSYELDFSFSLYSALSLWRPVLLYNYFNFLVYPDIVITNGSTHITKFRISSFIIRVYNLNKYLVEEDVTKILFKNPCYLTSKIIFQNHRSLNEDHGFPKPWTLISLKYEASYPRSWGIVPKYGEEETERNSLSLGNQMFFSRH